MFSTKSGLVKFSSLSLVVLFGWFALLTCTGAGGFVGQSSYAKSNFGPAADIFPSWIISPTNPVITANPIPAPVTLVPPTVPVTISVLPSVPWDTAYAKPGSVLQDANSGTYRMWYESARVITTTTNGLVLAPSGIGLAISLDGVNWSKPVQNLPIFAGSGQISASSCPSDVFSAWDSAYVGSPRVIYDGFRYRMFYVGSNIGGRFDATQAASIGVADSLDGINWCRAGRTTPVLTPTLGKFDGTYDEPAGVRIEGSRLKLYFTGSDNSFVPRTGYAIADNFTSTPTSALVLNKQNGGNPVKVNGSIDKIKGAYAKNVNGTLFFWFVGSSSGSDLIYQAYGNSEVDFTLDPNNNILKPVAGSPNENTAQSDIAGVIVRNPEAGTLQTTTAQMWFTGLSSTGLLPQGFRAESPVPIPTTPGAPPPVTSIILPTSAARTPTPAPGFPGLPPGIPNGGPGSYYTPTPGEGNYSPFFETWKRVDEPVRAGLANRSWIYSGLPYGFRFLRERYEEGSRLVLYHDKGRMEAFGNGGLTNGLLAKELISGLMQVGDNKFEPRVPAIEAIAGDAIEVNPNNPAYYSLNPIASLNNDRRIANRSGSGQQVIETIDRAGVIGTDFATANYGATYSYYEPILGHNIANVFWDFMQQSGPVFVGTGYANDKVIDWLSVVGLPLTEPYWTKATMNGKQVDVLVQAFERRILTFTPTNADPFKVEMGNVGRHYFRWRYNLNN